MARGDKIYNQRYRERHPDRVKQSRVTWQKKHPAAYRFLQQRNRLAYKLAWEWLKENHPGVIASCHRKSRQMMPIGDMVIEIEMNRARYRPGGKRA